MNNYFTIDLGKTYYIAEISILNLDGKLVFHKYFNSISKEEIQLSIPTGIYLAKIKLDH
ncbi:T9SS type A sorting domain-containing protein [Moheibacter sp. BDHS18]|uniref:T9SS type A sorting domain-containing protein n=1 Tax=Moheibacter lacus TaxID=2745851 RepID=A0A838ZUH9_9FLAO|nr:T9SS type A sorting domain-containing protein [Moheibacter lacus]